MCLKVSAFAGAGKDALFYKLFSLGQQTSGRTATLNEPKH